MARLNPVFPRVWDASGDPVSGGRFYVFQAGTTTPVTPYTDAALTIPHGSYATADAAGKFADIYVAAGSYKVRLTDASGATLHESDNVQAVTDGWVFFATRAVAMTGSTGSAAMLTVGNLEYTYDAAGTALTTGDGRKWSPAAADSVTLEHFGGGTAATGEQNSLAFDLASQWIEAQGGGRLLLGPHTYWLASTAYLRNGMHLVGHRGLTRLKLEANADCTVLETHGVATWDAWVSGSTAGYPINLFIDGVILDGNAEFQGAVSTTVGNLVYGLRSSTHRIGIGWLVVDDVKGVGIRSTYNPDLQSEIKDQHNYGYGGTPDGQSLPFIWHTIDIRDTLFEHLVFQGPADIEITNLNTANCGQLEPASPPSAPTSLLFPGETIQSVRIETAVSINKANINVASYGRAMSVADNTRFNGDTIILSGSWGGLLVGQNSFGCISNLLVQNNNVKFSTEHPYIECKAGAFPHDRLGRFSFPRVMIRRSGGSGASTAIFDDAGHQWGIIECYDGVVFPGHGLICGPNNKGGHYQSVEFRALQGLAHDGTTSTALILRSGADDIVIENVRTQRCARAILNESNNINLHIAQGYIDLNREFSDSGQIAMEGVAVGSQLAGAEIIITANSVGLHYLPKWNVLINTSSGEYRSSHVYDENFDLSSTGQVLAAAVAHRMWWQPLEQNCSQVLRMPTDGTARVYPYIHTLNAAEIRLGVTVDVAEAITATVSGRIN